MAVSKNKVVLGKDGKPKLKPLKKSKEGSLEPMKDGGITSKEYKPKVTKLKKKKPSKQLQKEEDLDEVIPWDEDEVKPVDVQGQKVIGKINVDKKSGSKPMEPLEELVEVIAELKETSKPMANIGFSLARTINLGNYESIKLSVSINVPSIVTEEEIEANYDFAKEWCESKLEDTANDWGV